MTGPLREGSMRERSIEDGKGSGMLMVDWMDVCDVQTNIPIMMGGVITAACKYIKIIQRDLVQITIIKVQSHQFKVSKL